MSRPGRSGMTPPTEPPAGSDGPGEDMTGLIAGIIVFTLVIIIAIIALMILVLRKLYRKEEEADNVPIHEAADPETTSTIPRTPVWLNTAPSDNHSGDGGVYTYPRNGPPVSEMRDDHYMRDNPNVPGSPTSPLSHRTDLSDYDRPQKYPRPVAPADDYLQDSSHYDHLPSGTRPVGPSNNESPYDHLPSPKPIGKDYDHPPSPKPVASDYDYLPKSPRPVESGRDHPLSKEMVESDYANVPSSLRAVKSNNEDSGANLPPTPASRITKDSATRPSFKCRFNSAKNRFKSVKPNNSPAVDDEPIYSNT